MKAGFSIDLGHAWLQKPIASGLLISAALHFAFVLLFQASPASQARQIVVINARLQPVAMQSTQPPQKADALTQPVLPEPEKRAVAEKTLVAEKPLLTAASPSVAPPVMLPMQPEPTPETPAKLVQLAPLPTPAFDPSTPMKARSEAPAPSKTAAADAMTGTPRTSSLPSLPIDIDSNWYQARQVDKHPKSIGQIEPKYPEEATRRNIEGTLKLMLKIDDLGRVQSVEVVEAVPPGVFDEAALVAFRAARFQPAMKDGRPVRYQAYMRVDFKLQD